MNQRRMEMAQAIDAGNRALESLREAESKLKSAGNWGLFDLFGGGFLATCGLRQVGEPCEGHGLHGRIDNIPAEEVGWRRWWEGDTLWAQITGTMYEACHQGEYLRLRRTIRLNHKEKKIWVEDAVQNLGSTPQRRF